MSNDKRVCIVCERRELADHEQQTCVHCLGRVRRALIDVEQLYALLPAEIVARAGTARPLDPSGVRGDDDPIPGGDALVLLAGGSTSTTSSRTGDRTHAQDNLTSDIPSVLATLASWEDDWRSVLELPAAQDQATIAGCSVFLLRGLSYMAQHHPAFDEFAEDMGDLQRHLQRVTRQAAAVDRGAPCPYCGSRIVRHYDDPDPCPRGCTHDGEGHDQGGRRDTWVCSNRDCHQSFSEDQHRMAIWQAHNLGRRAAG